GDAVVQHDEPAGLVRVLFGRMRDERRAHLLRDYHHRVRSIDSVTSCASQKSAERYFQPPSARTQTTTPSSSSSASFTATCTTAPAETPAKMPSLSSSARTAAIDSSFET